MTGFYFDSFSFFFIAIKSLDLPNTSPNGLIERYFLMPPMFCLPEISFYIDCMVFDPGAWTGGNGCLDDCGRLAFGWAGGADSVPPIKS